MVAARRVEAARWLPAKWERRVSRKDGLARAGGDAEAASIGAGAVAAEMAIGTVLWPGARDILRKAWRY